MPPGSRSRQQEHPLLPPGSQKYNQVCPQNTITLPFVSLENTVYPVAAANNSLHSQIADGLFPIWSAFRLLSFSLQGCICGLSSYLKQTFFSQAVDHQCYCLDKPRNRTNPLKSYRSESNNISSNTDAFWKQVTWIQSYGEIAKKGHEFHITSPSTTDQINLSRSVSLVSSLVPEKNIFGWPSYYPHGPLPISLQSDKKSLIWIFNLIPYGKREQTAAAVKPAFANCSKLSKGFKINPDFWHILGHESKSEQRMAKKDIPTRARVHLILRPFSNLGIQPF